MALQMDAIRALAERVAASHHLEVVDLEFGGGGKSPGAAGVCGEGCGGTESAEGTGRGKGEVEDLSDFKLPKGFRWNCFRA